MLSQLEAMWPGPGPGIGGWFPVDVRKTRVVVLPCGQAVLRVTFEDDGQHTDLTLEHILSGKRLRVKCR
jgi:hypothetical protein